MNRTPSEVCPQCGKPVEILNGDFNFSLELHQQSHKSLETVARDLDTKLRAALLQPEIKNTQMKKSMCPECDEFVDILNGDLTLSFQLHAQKHKKDFVESGVKNKSSISSFKNNQSKQTSILDAYFKALSPNLQGHKGFICKDEGHEVNCIVCKVKIGPIFRISDHLKTRVHEDQIIMCLKEKLPDNSNQAIEFITFHESMLSCNLCRREIILNPNNPHETIVNIFSHNATTEHREKISTNKICSPENAFILVKACALMNPLIHKNKHLIKYNTVPQFWCKVCSKYISYNQDKSQIIKNFEIHLKSTGHKKYLLPSVLKSFEELHTVQKSQHRFAVKKGNIFCTVCNCFVEVNVEKLILHTTKKALSLSTVLVESRSPTSVSSGTEKAQNNFLPAWHKKNQFTFCSQENGTETSSAIPQANPCAFNKEIPMKNNVMQKYLDGDVLSKELQHNCTGIIKRARPRRGKGLKPSLFKLLNSDENFSSDKPFLKMTEKQIICTICDCVFEVSINESSLRANLMSHLMGQKHKTTKSLLKKSHMLKSKQDLHCFSQELSDTTIREMFQTFSDSIGNEMKYSVFYREMKQIRI
uniref:Uncharacterized protein n=1 Tax=Graphocephala atropunctata TaxID=36148 RepID=A0A1B6K929_9HEMI